jgi:hypothetical protein
VLSQILDTCINGITLSDPDQPDNPIVYADDRRGQAIAHVVFLEPDRLPEEPFDGRDETF